MEILNILKGFDKIAHQNSWCYMHVIFEIIWKNQRNFDNSKLNSLKYFKLLNQNMCIYLYNKNNKFI